MNIRALNKLEPIYVKVDWSECFSTMKLSKNNLSTILDIIDTFKNKKSVKELVLLKYANVPIYATIFCSDIERLLDWMMPQFLETEDYESCKRITDIKKIINKK